MDWIPVTERLPENDRNVLICTTSGHMAVGYHYDLGWSDYDMFIEDRCVVAWQPLPAPFVPNEDSSLSAQCTGIRV